MAFSAISQAGYLVLGIMGGTSQGMTALVFYLFVYMAANLGAFAVLHVVEQNSGKSVWTTTTGSTRPIPSWPSS